MPFRRRPSRWAHVRKREGRAASTLQSAWRRRNRKRKGGLVARTAVANRRAIKNLKSDIEVKEANGHLAPVGSEFSSGQGNTTPVIVDDLGTMTNMTPPIPDTFACNLISVDGGTGANEMIGKQIVMKSLAVKCQVISDTRSASCTYHLYLIHDTEPMAAPLNLHDEILQLPQLGGVIPAPYGLSLAFRNKANVGKGKRVRILDHKVLHLSTCGYIQNGQSVPAMTQVAAGGVMRPLYGVFNHNNNCTNGRSSAEVTLFSKAPFKFEFAANAAAVTPVNQTIYLYAYQHGMGGLTLNEQPNSTLTFRANLRFTDP